MSRLSSAAGSALILRGMITVFVFSLIAKAFGALKEVAIAYAYGTTSPVDAYALAYNLAYWPVAFAGMCSSAILVPLLVDSRISPSDRTRMTRSLVAAALAFGLVASLVVAAVLSRAAAIFPNVAPDVVAPLEAQALSLSLLILPGVLASILVATLIAEGRQLSSLLEAIPSLVIVATLYVLSEYLLPATILGWGTAVGFAAYLGALMFVQRRLLRGMVPRLSWPGLSAAGAAPIAVLILAQAVFSLGGAVADQIAAAALPDNQNAVISYANRLLLLITGLGATAVARATLPVLSRMFVEDVAAARGLAYRWALGLTGAGLALALLGYLLAPLGVRLLFERGSFSAQDTAAVSAALRVGLAQLPFYFGSIVLAQAVVVTRRFRRMLLANSLGVATKVAILYLYLPQGGVTVIMLSTASMYLVTTIALWVAIRELRGGRA